jgi:type II secretory pathway pseudopilin PulG
VVVAIIALLIAILIPSLGRAKELANRSACGANLTGIVKAMNLYSAENSDQFPVVQPQGGATSPSNATTPTAVLPAVVSTSTTGDLAIQSIYTQTSATLTPSGDHLANVWLMVLKGEVGPKQFICKSDPMSPVAQQANNGTAFYLNFPTVISATGGPAESYGFAYAWSATSGSVGGWWKATVDSSVAIGADVGLANAFATKTQSAGGPKVSGNSANHSGGEGQEVVFSDTHVEFDKVDNIGQASDNIYAWGAPSATAGTGTYFTANTGGAITYNSTISGTYDIVMWPVRTQSGGSGW